MASGFLHRLGLRLLPLFQPTRDEDRRDRERLQAAIAAQGERLRAQEEELRHVRRDLRETRAAVDAVQTERAADMTRQREQLDRWAKDLAAAHHHDLRRLQLTVSRNSSFVKGVLGQARHVTPHAVEQQRVRDRLQRIAASGRPIIVGPWTGEVGFELIYWVPFVRWFVEEYGVDPGRLVVVSRGGPLSWYGELGHRYRELLEIVTPGELVDRDGGRTRKQRHAGPRDRRVIRRLARDLGRPSVLHPMYLYGLCGAYFEGFAGVRTVFDVLRHRSIAVPAASVPPGLPPDFVAAKFYFSPAFPDTPGNRAFADALLARIATRYPVVLLEHGAAVDDHGAYRPAPFQDLGSLGIAVTPQNNLEVQTAVVSRARAFVGTYGGFSYLPPLCGVQSISFHSGDEFYLHHRHLADEVFARLHAPSPVVLPTRSADLFGGVLTALDEVAAPRSVR